MSYESPAKAEVYIPYQQYIFATFMSTIVVRTEGEPTALAAALRKQVWAVDPNQPVVKSGNDGRGDRQLHLASTILGVDLFGAERTVRAADRDRRVRRGRVHIHSAGTARWESGWHWARLPMTSSP